MKLFFGIERIEPLILIQIGELFFSTLYVGLVLVSFVFTSPNKRSMGPKIKSINPNNARKSQNNIRKGPVKINTTPMEAKSILQFTISKQLCLI